MLLEQFLTFFHCYSSGMTFSEKWNTDNILATEITVEDQIAKGLKVSFDTSFAPQTGYVFLCLDFSPSLSYIYRLYLENLEKF